MDTQAANPIRIGVVGYGNLGRGVENAVAKNPDMVVAGIYTRRDPAQLKPLFAGTPVFSMADLEGHAVTVLAGIDRRDVIDGQGNVLGNAPETGLKGDHLVADHQALGRIDADVEDDLPILDELARHQGPVIDSDGHVGRQPLIGAPLVDGADQIGLGGDFTHGADLRAGKRRARRPAHGAAGSTAPAMAQRRITFSEGVIASMKPWRLKMRSAYFISGAAALPRSMP